MTLPSATCATNLSAYYSTLHCTAMVACTLHTLHCTFCCHTSACHPTLPFLPARLPHTFSFTYLPHLPHTVWDITCHITHTLHTHTYHHHPTHTYCLPIRLHTLYFPILLVLGSHTLLIYTADLHPHTPTHPYHTCPPPPLPHPHTQGPTVGLGGFAFFPGWDHHCTPPGLPRRTQNPTGSGRCGSEDGCQPPPAWLPIPPAGYRYTMRRRE